jgi:mRNA interferase RelE/StbE
MPEPKTYAVRITPAAWQSIMSLPEKVQEKIFSAIESLELDTRPGNSKMLKHEWSGYRRVRAGNYRVIYTIKDDALIVLVVKVGDRRDVYE